VDRSMLRMQYAAEVKNYNPLEYFGEKFLTQIDRFAQFALISAREAVNDAGIKWTDELGKRCCVITGTGIGGQETQDNVFCELYKNNFVVVHPAVVPRIMPNAAASHITMEFNIRGLCYTISTACASSNHAIGNAYWMIRHGQADMAITGGSEAPLSYGCLKAWDALRVVSRDFCRPFSKDRIGMILGECGSMLVLENLDSALERNAKIYCEIVGFGMSSDAGHITRPSPEGAGMAMEGALKDAEVEPELIDYINAHGTGTLANDVMEVAAIKSVFGDHARKLAVSSTKSMHGHALGGTSAQEAVITCLSLYNQTLPPTINFTEPDPECDIDVVPNQSRKSEINYALSNAFAFGGLNAVLAFRRWNES
jgi:nodulation protein E